MKNRCILLFLVLLFLAGSGRAQELKPYLSTGHDKAVRKLAWAGHGAYLVSLGDDGKCIVWDFFQRREINNILLKTADFGIVDDSVLYSPGDNLYRSIPGLDVLPDYHPGQVKDHSEWTFTISHSGARLLCDHREHRVFVIPKLIKPFTGVAFNSDTGTLAYVCGDPYILLRRLADLRTYHSIEAGDTVISVVFHPMLRQLLVAATPQGAILVFDIGLQRRLFTLQTGLIRPTQVYEDIRGRNIILNDRNNAYVFNYGALQLSQYPLPHEHPVPKVFIAAYDDSLKKTDFYFWRKNYAVYRAEDDTVRRVQSFPSAQFNDKVLRAFVQVVGTDVNPLLVVYNVAAAILHPQPLPEQPVYLQTDSLTSISINIHGRVVEHAGTAKKVFRSLGSGPTVYAEDDSVLLTWRAPWYLNLFRKGSRAENANFYVPDISRLYSAGNFVYAAQQTGGILLLERKGMDLHKGALLPGQFIAAGAGGREIYTKTDNHLDIYTIEGQLVQSLTVDADHTLLYAKAVGLPGGGRNYLLFYDVGIVEYRTALDQLIGTFYCYTNGNFIFMLPDNSFYASSKSQIQNVLLRENNAIYQLDQFEAKFNRPDKAMEALQYVDTGRLRLYREVYRRYVQKVGSAEIRPEQLPVVRVEGLGNRYYTQDTVLEVHVRYSCSNYLRSVNLYVNGVPLYNKAGLSLEGRRLAVLDTLLCVPLSQGDNLIKPVCVDSNYAKNFVRAYYIKAAYAAKPRVYFVGIAAEIFDHHEYNLKYPIKDIRDLAVRLRSYYHGQLEVDTFMGRRVTTQAITDTLRRLARRLRVNDKVIIAYSGHGLVERPAGYYLSTYGVDFDHPSNGGLAYSELENLADSLPARYKIMFIDACNSGELDSTWDAGGDDHNGSGGRGVPHTGPRSKADNSFYIMQDIFSDYSQGTGTVVISASRGNQSALEGDEWGNGAFTHCVLEGLEGNRADLDKDGVITVSELKEYVSRRVAAITHGHQRPTARKDVLDDDWVF
jgi:hypothetical protein